MIKFDFAKPEVRRPHPVTQGFRLGGDGGYSALLILIFQAEASHGGSIMIKGQMAQVVLKMSC
jgi:hypothetical protein